MLLILYIQIKSIEMYKWLLFFFKCLYVQNGPQEFSITDDQNGFVTFWH